MLPAILQKLLKAFGDKFDPSAVRGEYTANKDLWRVYLDLLEMDGNKLAAMLVKHNGEEDGRYELRQQLAAIFNYVPLIVRMTVNYLHSEQPTFDIADESLKAFLKNCNGNGKSFANYVRSEALPLALALGWIDVLIQNPELNATDEILTAADQQQNPDLAPRVFTITPLQRTNWSVQANHQYNWIRFRDTENDNANPFVNDSTPQKESYLTISGATAINNQPIADDAGNQLAFWFRSSREVQTNDSGAATAPDNAKWDHDGDWLPTTQIPIATLYYQQSIDPMRKHFGLSKISMIAILTLKIIQLLSWSDEDVLANLALFVFPGDKPKDEKGNPIDQELSPFDIIYIGDKAQVAPSVLQGDEEHIRVKWEIIDAYMREILRLAYLIGASAEAEQITSGVQGVVARTELFQELADLAGQLDSFGLQVLAMVKTLSSGEEWDVERLTAELKPTVNYYKGNYAIDPMDKVIANAQSLIETFRDISPTMVEAVYRQLAQSALYNEDVRRDAVFREITEFIPTLATERNNVARMIVDTANTAAGTEPTEPAAQIPEVTPAAPEGGL
jgi:hypothetical protein